MNDANDSRPSEPAGVSSSKTDPNEVPAAAADTDAQTFVQKTLSESGTEGRQVSPWASGSVTIGSMLGPYQIVRKLGQGGMGAVYEARHTKLKKTVAVKVLPPETMKSAVLITRFEREMEAVGALDHPNIVRSMDAGEFNGTHFLVMEYVDGSDLSVLVKEHGVLSVSDACEAIRQAALGLQHAHEHGLVHRDIKPSNLLACSSAFRRSDGTAPPEGGTTNIKILDLGLARLGGDDNDHAGLTSSGQMLGTPDYMAPEQWDDTRSADARADLYSLGCTLGFLLIGKAPFDNGKQRSFLHIMKAHSDAPPPDLSVLRPDVPAELNALFQRLLAKKPEARFQSATEVAQALEVFLHQHDAPASGRERSPHAPREESRTSIDADRTPDSQATTDITRAPGSPVAERQGDIDSHTTSIMTPRQTSRRPSRRVWFIAGSLLACVVLGGIIFKITTAPRSRSRQTSDHSTSDPTNAASDRSLATSATKTANAGWHGWPADAPAPAIAPFDAERAKQHQRAWAEYLKLPVEYTNSLGMKFVLIPPGEFTMGSTAQEIEETLKDVGDQQHSQDFIKSEGPQHKVILTKTIYLGIHEVTQKEYAAVMGMNPSHFSSTGAGKETVTNLDTQNHPVEMVSWNDAAEFCAKLSQKDELKSFYFRAGETVTPLAGTGYRLPTEAEWEFACRAGTTTKFWTGNNDDDLVWAGWFGTNSGGRTHASGELKANPLGLFDTHGNLWEWMEDGWEPTYYGQFSAKPAINPSRPFVADTQRVLHGGNWVNPVFFCLTSRHVARSPADRDHGIGFRVALPADAVKESLKRLRVAAGRAAPPSSDDPIDFAAERQAAERLLRLGKGRVFLANKDQQWIVELKAPLPVEPFCILEVNFEGADVTDEDLAVLAGCRAFYKINLGGNRQVTAAGLRKLGPQPFLKELFIGETNIGNDAIDWLANAPMLMSLNAGYNPINAEGWETLPPCNALRGLDTSGQVGDAGLRRIVEQCPELRSLLLWDGTIADLSPLARLMRLRSLHTGPNSLSESGIETLLKLPVFDELKVENTDAAGLQRLRRLSSKLTRFSFRNNGGSTIGSSADWAAVTEMTGLLELSIGGDVAIDGAALHRVAAMKNLRRFTVNDDSNGKAKFRAFTPDDVAAFRRERPDVELSISDQSYPALSDWPGKFEGSTRIADWTELPPGGPTPAIGTFSPDIAQQRQEEWAKHLQQPVEIELDVAEVARLQKETSRAAEDVKPKIEVEKPKDGTLASPATKPAATKSATTLKFRLIPPSEATINIGTPEQPRLALHRVSQPYYLGTTEVTVGQFQQFVAATGYVTDAERLKNGFNLQFQLDPNATWKTPGYAISDDLPVTIISPADAQAFCAWLNESSPLVPREESRTKSDADAPIKPNDKPDVNAPRPSSRGTRGLLYRLPTEREWELASRAGGAGDYGFAGNAQGVLDYAWTAENVAGKPIPVQPVATKRANPFGLHDVLGNVWEWYTTEQGKVRGATGNGFENTSGESTFLRRAVGTHFVQPNAGFRVVRQLQPSSPAPKFAEHPVLVPRHTPLGPQATVTRPTPIPGLRSWTIELASHQYLVSAIAWSPQGDLIATTSVDMTVRLWDRNGNLKSILLGHAGGTTAGTPDTVSFSPDGTRLATVDMSTDLASPSTLRIWDVSGLPIDRGRSRETSDDPANPELSQVRLLAVVPLRSWGWCVAWSPDGKQIAYGGTQWMCEILDVTTGQARSLNVEGDLASLAWSADSRTLCVPEKWLPTLFDVASGQKLATLTAPEAKPEEALASRVAWSPDGRWLSGAHGKQVRIWDAATRKHLRTIPIEFDAGSLAWHKESQLLAITPGGGGTPFVLDTTSGEVAARGPAHIPAFDIAWSPDGNELVFPDHNRSVLHFLDGPTGKLLRSGPERGQNRLDPFQPKFLSPDGRRFHAKQTESTVERFEFDAETGVLLERRKTPQGWLLATASDERWRAYQKSDTEVVIEPKRFDRDPVTITTPGASWIWRSDPSGERIAQAFGQQVLIWDATTGKPLGTLPHPAKLWSCEWSPDGKQLATAADDKTIRLWNTQTNKLTAEFKQFPQELDTFYYRAGGAPILAWTRDGRGLWIPLGTHAGLLDLSTGRVAPVENFSNGNVVGSLTLASDGDRLLVREESRTFLRDRDGSRQLLGQWLGYRPQWHPDSRRFLSGADLFGVRGYDVTTRQRLGTLWPVLTANHWLCIGPTGHYRGGNHKHDARASGDSGASGDTGANHSLARRAGEASNVEDHIVYVAQLDDGTHITLSPAEFATRFGWKNDPEKVSLLKLSDEK